MKLVAASGMCGYGFDESAFERAMAMGPAAIGCDAGSMDPGPYYLGAGQAFVSREAYRRDLDLMIAHGRRLGIPVIVGSAGGGGGEPHLAWSLEILGEIARARGLALKVAVIHAEPDKAVLRRKLAEGRIRPLGPMPELTAETLDKSARIVAMMGAEPLMRALAAGVDVVLAGRASDSAIYAAPALRAGFPKGPAWHLGKIIECGAAVALPKVGSDCMVGHLEAEHFLVETPNPARTCPRIRVAAHTLYENPSPYHLVEPSGMLDTSACTYEQAGERAVRVSGSAFVSARQYTVKLEGVALAGYRTLTIGGVRDPGLIDQIGPYLDALKANLKKRVASVGLGGEPYELVARVYGKDGVMGEREPLASRTAHELGILLDVTAATQEKARTILSMARHLLLHSDFEGRLCIAGNIAFPYSPSDVDTGPVYRFSVWHVAELDDPCELFPTEIVTL
ncbi:MAG: acyclic terpene utilization AtuA family protein [Candidatus Lambdaproteobacteria bacterium]|nr:acyclic terpene utilization AtuA family protein [Candidatus Lambdaproteobacteria bacterium]